MSIKLKKFAVISKDYNYGKRLSDDLLPLCGENGCNFAFCVFTDVCDLKDRMGLDAVTHIILVPESGGSQVARELRNAAVLAPIMLLTDSVSDMGALFRQTGAYGAHPPQSKEDLAHIMNLPYGSDNRFLPKGSPLQILPVQLQ